MRPTRSTWRRRYSRRRRGKYVTSTIVSISDATAGATIYYTLDGTTPTTKSPKYTAPIKVLDSETIKAIAVAAGHAESAVASAAYTLDVATPVFSPAAGTYSTAQSVKITDATAGATIYYTINGTTPTPASTKYTAAIAVKAAETIKAIAVAAGHTESAVASATYTIGTPTDAPVFSPAGGTYNTAQSVKITDATAGATIYYTTNGATPTTASTKYTAAIAVSATETITAIALSAGHLESAVASATYTISSGGGGSTEFFLPGTATSTGTGGKTGLFVVPAGAPTAAPTFITTTAVKVLNISFQFASVTSGSLGQYNPYALIYLGVGGDGKYHVYGLPLTGTTVPKPVQISNLSLSAIADLCNDTEAEANNTQPTTGFGLVEIPSSGTCTSGSSHVFEVIRYTDSPSTAPSVVNVTTTDFKPIYVTSGPAPGALAGMVMLDAAAKELLFYTSDAFTSPKTLVTGVIGVSSENVNYPGLFSGIDADFFAVTKTGGKQYLYRIDASGDAVSEYTAAGSLEFGIDVVDKNNFYFIDDVTSGGISGTATFLQVPLSGGAVTNLYALAYSPLEISNTLIGSNGSLLVYASNSLPTQAGNLYTVPVGSHSATATHLGSTFAGDVTGRLYGPTPGAGESNAVLFVNVLNEKLPAGTISYASESLLPNDTVKQGLKANSQFLLDTVISETSYGDLFQLQGITDTNGGSGGAKLYGVNIASGAATPYTTTGGGDYVVPTDHGMFVVPISSVIGVGDTVLIKSSHTDGLVYNSTTHVIVTVSLPNADVVMY